MPTTFVAKLSRDELERRRLEAGTDLQRGTRQADVARKYGVPWRTVHRWKTVLDAKGLEGLRRTKAPGKPSYLTPDQWKQLARMLQQGPTAHGYKTDLWTSPRVQRLIRETFGVRFNPNYVREALKQRLGFTRQRPRRIARERDDEKRQEWLDTTWVELRKGRKTGSGR